MQVDERLRENYAGYYVSDQSEWRRIGANDKAENIVALCSPYPVDSVLEIGAGEGAVLARLGELGFAKRLYALELSSSGVEAIRKRSIASLIECLQFDGYSTPFNDQQFDLAILTHVVEHVEHPRILLREAMRVARLVFVEVPLEDTVRLGLDYLPSSVGHINFYSRKTIRRLLQTSGLRILAERIQNPSRAAHTFHRGTRGRVDHAIKQLLLRMMPSVAPSLVTYHAAYLCERNEDSSLV